MNLASLKTAIHWYVRLWLTLWAKEAEQSIQIQLVEICGQTG